MPERRLDPVLQAIQTLKSELLALQIEPTSPNHRKRQRALDVLESVDTILRATCENMEVGAVGYYGFDFGSSGSGA